MLFKRIIVAVIFIPVFIFLILKGGVYFLALVCAVVAAGLFEFCQGEKERRKDVVLRNILLGVCIPLAVYFKGEEVLPFVITFIIFTVFLWELFKLKPPEARFNIALSVGGILYISYLFSFVVIMRQIPFVGAKLVITVFFATWMGDTGAFVVGKIMGRHRFLPVYSAGKSVEGFIGAILFSLLAVFVSRIWIAFPLLHTFILGILFGAGGQTGDFFESMLKRGLGIKDFGRILPGHGGVLDRFDSLFFTVPAFFYYTKYIIGFGGLS